MVTGIVTEMPAVAINANCGGRDHGAIYVGRAVIDWCRQLFDFLEEASGLIVSGTSMANLIALTVACNARPRFAGTAPAADRLRRGPRIWRSSGSALPI